MKNGEAINLKELSITELKELGFDMYQRLNRQKESINATVSALASVNNELNNRKAEDLKS